MNKENKIISIVVPVYNEEEVIEIFIEELFKVLQKIKYSYEVIIVDDGSHDKTTEKIKNLRKRYSAIKFLSFSRNFGHQCALFAGIKHASGSAIVMMDGDLQHPPSLIINLLEEWKSGAKVVQTIRRDVNIPILKKITSKLFYFLLNIFSETKFIASSPDFRLIDREVANELLKFKENDVFLRGLIPWLGYKSTYVYFEPQGRFAGKSKYSIFKMIKFSVSGITSFSTLPLKIAIFVGIIIAILSFALGIQSLYIRIFTDQAVQGWTSLMIGVFFIGGLLMIFLGVLGEYIGNIYLQAKDRPRYIIVEHLGFEKNEEINE